MSTSMATAEKHRPADEAVRAVIYARYSCSAQNEQSIEGQIKDCRAFAERCGFLVVGEYIDRALTGLSLIHIYALARLSARAPEAIPAADALRELALAHLTMEPGDACQTSPGGAPPEILYRCRDGVRHICGMYRVMECDGYYTPEAKDCAKPNLAALTRTQKAEYAAYRALGSVEQLAKLKK